MEQKQWDFDKFEPIKTTSILEDMKFEPVETELSGCIVLGMINIISAHPGSMKTMTMMKWAEALTEKKKCYNKLEVSKRRKVLYLDAEESCRSFEFNCRKLDITRNDDFFYASVQEDYVDLYNNNYRYDLLNWIEQQQIEIVIMDSVGGGIFKGDDSSQTDIQDFRDILTDFLRKDVTVVLLMHNNKGAGTKANDYAKDDWYRGSTMWRAMSRMFWAMKMTQDEATGEQKIEFYNTKNSFDKKKQAFELMVTDTSEGKISFEYKDELSKITRVSDSILGAIIETPGIKQTDLLTTLKDRDVKISKNILPRELDRLERLGEIEHSYASKGRKTWHIKGFEDKLL